MKTLIVFVIIGIATISGLSLEQLKAQFAKDDPQDIPAVPDITPQTEKADAFNSLNDLLLTFSKDGNKTDSSTNLNSTIAVVEETANSTNSTNSKRFYPYPNSPYRSYSPYGTPYQPFRSTFNPYSRPPTGQMYGAPVYNRYARPTMGAAYNPYGGSTTGVAYNPYRRPITAPVYNSYGMPTIGAPFNPYSTAPTGTAINTQLPTLTTTRYNDPQNKQYKLRSDNALVDIRTGQVFTSDAAGNRIIPNYNGHGGSYTVDNKGNTFVTLSDNKRYQVEDLNGTPYYTDLSSGARHYMDSKTGNTVYVNADGTTYYTMNGITYYTQADGSTYYVNPTDGVTYYIDANGQSYVLGSSGQKMYSNGDGTYYYTDANGQRITVDSNGNERYVKNGITYYIGTDGRTYKLVNNVPYYSNGDNTFYFYDQSGNLVNVDQYGIQSSTQNGTTVYFNPNDGSQYTTDNVGNVYGQNSDGSQYIINTNGCRYNVDSTGATVLVANSNINCPSTFTG